MDFVLILKAGFLGFGLSLGVQFLVFYLAGQFLGASIRHFIRVFLLAAVASFLAVDLLLYIRIPTYEGPHSQLFLVGCIGGWLGGLASGLTQMRGYLLRFLNR